MKPMIDIHSHVAWGIDDGMPDIENAAMALDQAKADGITVIASTPHLIPGYTQLEDIIERQKDLKALARQKGIVIRNGAELFMNRKSIEVISEGFVRPYEGTNYQLCEYDLRRPVTELDYIDEPLYELEVKGLVPVIAHVERYFSKKLDLDLIEQWHNAGYVIQINRTSINGAHGKVCQENAFKILDAGLAHVVATDTHRASGSRVEKLSDAWQILADRYGEENADLLLSENPKAVLKGEKVRNMNISAPKKKKKKFLFF